MSVYPNPAHSIITVNGTHIASVEVIDNLGRIVSSQYLMDAMNPAINLSRLQAGMYHIRIQNTDGSTNKVSFIKE